MTVRPAVPEDREALEAIVRETPDLPFPEDLFAWPTIEIGVVEDDAGEILGFGFVQAIPEAHVVMRRRGPGQRTKRRALELLHHAATRVIAALKVPYLRLPVRQDVPALVLWASQLPRMQGDARTHLMLVGAKGDE